MDIDLSDYDYEDGQYRDRKSKTPDSEVRCGCSKCNGRHKRMEKKKKINELLDAMEYGFNTKYHPDMRNAFWYIHKIIKILRIMNDR